MYSFKISLHSSGDASPPFVPLVFNPIQIRYMKKTILFIVTTSFIFCNANSQITKGNWMVGGNISYSNSNNNSSAIVLNKTSVFSMTPNVGYFVANRFATGVKLSFVITKITYPPSSGSSSSYGNENQSYNIIPFVRFYFLDPMKTVNMFIEGGFQHQISKNTTTSSTDNQTANGYLLNIGSAIFLNNVVGIEFTVGYSSMKFSETTGSNNKIQTGLGLQIHLEKDK